MSTTLQRSTTGTQSRKPVRPSKVDSSTSKPFTLDQELKPFGTWADAPIWVPPKDASTDMAESMLRKSGLLTSKSKSWDSVVEQHRDSFTQVREIELSKASIRLPKGRLFVSVTEQQHFDRITDNIPNCVQTRLHEFLASTKKKKGVKVSYLKPLCVEVGDELLFTSREDVFAAIDKIQQEVFSEYRRLYLFRRPIQVLTEAINGTLAIPSAIANNVVQRRQRAIDAYQARLEFQRRKIALDAAKTHNKCRTDGCTFDEMLALTNPLKRDDVIRQYSIEEQLSSSEQEELLRIAAGHLPWFAGLSLGLSYVAAIAAIAIAPPLAVCDPAFVAEVPETAGVLWNIGHFDEIAGVPHIEL